MAAFPVLGAACLALFPTEVGKAALKATLAGTLKGAVQIGGGVLGVALSLPGMISNIKELVKGDHVTEASQSLRDTAKEMKTVAEDFEKELDLIQKIIKEISEVKSCIESLDYCDPATKKSESQIQRERIILDFLRKHEEGTSQNQYLLQWIESMDNFAQFLNLVLYLNKLLHEKKKKKKKQTDEVHIIFVAHGEITKHPLPAHLLVPRPAIKDTILYSPWNCAIDSKVAYGIAKGCIEHYHRDFFCSWCKAPEADHKPSDLPGKWNHMKDAGFIPEIILHPVKPDEDAWKRLESLDKELPEDRILLPYLLPKGVNPELFPGVSFHILISALNLVLMICGVKATVHLAAFLCQYSRRDESVFHEYSYADDYTIMTTTGDMKVDHQSDLYKYFRPMFGESPSCRSRSYHP
ncbi:uncharacterized protein [Osmerus mordax]|uniref:uncharacterized protein n=1 Tax=Osmerus mordax TaxID=8014 RepID=UPI00350EF5E8